MESRSGRKSESKESTSPPAKKHKKSKVLPPKAWPPPLDAFPLSLYQPPSIAFDLQKTLKFLSKEDPAAFLDYGSDAAIHAGCGVAGSPVAVGATPAITAQNLRAWVVAQFVAASPNCLVNVGGVASSSAFHRLSNNEWGNLINAGLAFLPWLFNMVAAGHRLGSLYWATPIPGGGGGGGRSPQAQHWRGWLPFGA